MTLPRPIACLAVGMLVCMHSGGAPMTEMSTALRTPRLQMAPDAALTVAVQGPSFSALAATGGRRTDRTVGPLPGVPTQAGRRSATDSDVQPGPPEDTPWGWALLAAAAAAAMLARRRGLD